MSRNNMELGKWGDGTIRLAYWDSEHGDDRIYILHDDGTASEATIVFVDDDDDEGVEELRPVDLVERLRALAKGGR